ncbi:putative baseplate assembly protein [Chloroflexi bacterium TSY]|nr:putative baseplate assembly protein [Chloroflexi bacterium TSY]
MSTNNRPTIDYTNKDYVSLREALLNLAQEKLPTWTDHSPNDLGVLLLELFAFMGDSLFYYQDRIANESYLETAVERRSVLNLLRLIGYELRPPQPASADLTLLFDDVPPTSPNGEEEGATAESSSVTIEPGTEFKTDAQMTGESIHFRYIRDEPLTIELTELPVESRNGDSVLRFDPLPVVQVDDKISQETVGSSNGSAGQRFALARMPLIDETLVVMVDEGSGPQAWERQQTLLYSQPFDRHYIVRRDENDLAWIEFGDGIYGKIPRRGQNHISASYCVGGGTKGNVPANSITKNVTKIAGLHSLFNENAAAGGAEHEEIAEASKRGPHLFRTMGSAVTAQDYEYHARQFGVGKVWAQAAGWNRIELYVAPAGGGQPSDTLKEDLRSYLEDKRIMTSLIEIRDPRYVDVAVEGTLDVEPYSFAQQVQQQVEDAVRNLLAFDQVKFNDILYLSKVYEVIEAIPGVRGINVTRYAMPDSPSNLPPEGKLEFARNEIPRAKYANGIQLVVRGGRRAD